MLLQLPYGRGTLPLAAPEAELLSEEANQALIPLLGLWIWLSLAVLG